jgi:nucleoside-diphosphate-sugar epimerase
MSSTVCVTGGAGFIGSHVAEAAVERGHEVHVIDDFSTGHPDNLRSFESPITVHEFDMRDETQLRDVLESVDQVFHQAALPSVPRSMEQPVTSTDITLMGAVKLFNAAVETGVNRVVFASSSSVYGDQPELPKVETMEPDPRSPYAASKRSKEIFARVFAEEFDLPVVGLRYFNVFGPRQDPTSDYSAVIPAFVSSMLRGNRPTIYGDGEQSRDFTYVADVVEANFKAMENGEPGMSYNVGYNQQTTVNELFEMIRKIIGVDLDPRYDDPRPGDVRHSRADAKQFYEDTGFEPSYDVRGGLRETIEWYESHPELWRDDT